MSHTKIRRLLFLFFALSAMSAQGQFYDSGQDRFRRLSHIKTAHFDVIFSQSETALGQIYANNLERVYMNGGKTLGWQPRRVPAVLFTSAAYANGEVAWAPRRMNLLTTASPDNYQHAWNQQLVLHEFRHVVQTDMLNQGASRFFSVLLGEQYTGLLLGLHVPYWFLEGDAVAYETGASLSGRGRTGDFTNRLAAQVAQKGVYSYQKAMFGSFADNVPTRYHLGYQLISYGRQQYGAQLWPNAMTRVARHPIALRPFGRGIRETTGLKEVEFYRAALQPLAAGAKNAAPDNARLLTKPTPRDYTSYFVPQKNAQGKVVALREQLSDIPLFVAIDTDKGRIRKITRPGPMSIKHFSTSGNLLVWNQLRHTRWENANHSQIVTYDLDRHRKRTLVRRGRYYGSTLSHSATQIASISYADSSQWAVELHNLDGSQAARFQTGNSVPVRVAWSDDDKRLAYIAIEQDCKSVSVIDLERRTIDTVLPQINDDISNLLFSSNKLYMTGNHNGNTAWYAYSLTDNTFGVVAESPFGVGTGSVSGDSLLFTYYTADGFQIAEKQIDNPAETEMPTAIVNSQTQALAEQEQRVVFGNDSVYKVQRYSRLAHLINIHSWGPLSVRIDDSEVGPGLTIMSQDALSTSFLTAGYQWLAAESKDDYFLEYRYKGFFPIIGARGDIYKFKTQQETNKGTYTFDVRRKRGVAFVQVPMTLKTSVFTTSLTAQASYQYINTELSYGRKAVDTTDHTLGYCLYFQSLRRLAHRDLQSRWGIVLRGDYHHYIDQPENHQTAAQAWLYLPGPYRNQGITIYGGWQESNRNNLVFNSLVLYPRGYKAVPNTRLKTLMISYCGPLFYPDLSIGSALYIKRIKGKLFCDFAEAVNEGKTTSMRSTGYDLTVDFHIYRFAVPISAGMRYARRISKSDNYFGFLLSMNFNGMMGNQR